MNGESVFSCILRIIIKLALGIGALYIAMRDGKIISQYGTMEIILGGIAVVALVYCILTVISWASWLLDKLFIFIPERSDGVYQYGHWGLNIFLIIIIAIVIMVFKDKIFPIINDLSVKLNITGDKPYYIVAAFGMMFLIIDIIRLIRSIRYI